MEKEVRDFYQDGTEVTYDDDLIGKRENGKRHNIFIDGRN